jgi:exodeoxyribonuclease VII large subunit
MLYAVGINPEIADLGNVDPNDIHSVTALSQDLKQILSQTPQLNDILVKGEISNFSAPTSGHIYFDLKDESSIIACAFFSHLQTGDRIDLSNGLQVIAIGSVTVYEIKSKYQLNVKKIIPIGDGIFSLKLRQCRDKLEGEGLFRQDRKKPIPRLPRKVGIITSKDSTAIKDILNVVSTRFPKMNLLMAYVTIQGIDAPSNIIQALWTLIKMRDIDAIVLARGGGSSEDFMVFNDEELVRVIASSTKPVITGIGHERDVCLADLAADVRASTPSNAAIAVIPDFQELRNNLLYLKQSLERSYKSNLIALDVKEKAAYKGEYGDKPRKKACYIATAVYGEDDAWQVKKLRKFRDETLSNHWMGRFFIEVYYAVSPYFVLLFKDLKPLNFIARKLLDIVAHKIG